MSLAPTLLENDRARRIVRTADTYDELREHFERALDRPENPEGLPSPGRGFKNGANTQSLAEWWGSNVTDQAPVIALVVKLYRAGDEDAKALIAALAHEYADFYCDLFDTEEESDELDPED